MSVSQFHPYASDELESDMGSNEAKGIDEAVHLQPRSRIIEATRDEQAVGWVFLDTDYPPYAEISGLLVHPNYVKEAEDIGKELIERSISWAEKSNCSIFYTVEWKISPSTEKYSLAREYGTIWHRLYSKYGFKPAIIYYFEKNDMDVCLFNLSNSRCYNEFMSRHPLSILSISRDLTGFNGGKAHEMKWTDPQTDEFLAFYIEGNRYNIRPKILGIGYKEGTIAFEAGISNEKSNAFNKDHGTFSVYLKNKGKEALKTHLDIIVPKGITIKKETSSNISSETRVGKEKRWEVSYIIEPLFKIPKVSYNTILITSLLHIDGLSTFPVSTEIKFNHTK